MKQISIIFFLFVISLSSLFFSFSQSEINNQGYSVNETNLINENETDITQYYAEVNSENYVPGGKVLVYGDEEMNDDSVIELFFEENELKYVENLSLKWGVPGFNAWQKQVYEMQDDYDEIYNHLTDFYFDSNQVLLTQDHTDNSTDNSKYNRIYFNDVDIDEIESDVVLNLDIEDGLIAENLVIDQSFTEEGFEYSFDENLMFYTEIIGRTPRTSAYFAFNDIKSNSVPSNEDWVGIQMTTMVLPSFIDYNPWNNIVKTKNSIESFTLYNSEPFDSSDTKTINELIDLINNYFPKMPSGDNVLVEWKSEDINDETKGQKQTVVNNNTVYYIKLESTFIGQGYNYSEYVEYVEESSKLISGILLQDNVEYIALSSVSFGDFHKTLLPYSDIESDSYTFVGIIIFRATLIIVFLMSIMLIIVYYIRRRKYVK